MELSQAHSHALDNKIFRGAPPGYLAYAGSVRAGHPYFWVPYPAWRSPLKVPRKLLLIVKWPTMRTRLTSLVTVRPGALSRCSSPREN